MNLDTTLRKLQIVLANAKTTSDMSVVVDYADMTSPAQTYGVSPSSSNGTTPVDILAAPAQGVQRIVQALTVSNKDTVPQVPTINLNDNGTTYAITTETLGPGETLGYTINLGWYVQDANGNRKTAASNLYTNTTSNLLGTASPNLPSFDCTQSGGALTFSMVAQYIAFRNVSATSGTPSVINAAPANSTLPNGSTLGFTSGVGGRILAAVMNNAGTAELAFCNQAGGLPVNEEGFISTTAISAGSTAANVWYSTTGRTNLAYKLMFAIDVVNTGGAWGSPTNKVGASFMTALNMRTTSMVQLNTANGYGSTNTVIRRFTNTVVNQGLDITYADSATAGASFTINTNGVYSISFSDSFTGAANCGLSLNSNQLTTSITSITVANILGAATPASANYAGNVGWTGYLASGSVVRAHNNGVAAGTAPAVFTISRVA